MGVRQLAEYVRRERELAAPGGEVHTDSDGRFPQSYGRPIVLCIGVIVCTVAAWVFDDVGRLTSDEFLLLTAYMTIGWLPIVVLRRRVGFRVAAIALALASFPLALAALGYIAFLAPVPGLAASTFDPPPRTRANKTAWLVAGSIALLATLTVLIASGLPDPSM